MDHPESLIAIFADWRRFGVSFTGPTSHGPVDLELLIIRTAQHASLDERLFVGAAAWLARFHDFVDGRRLSELTRHTDRDTSAYLGALLTLAVQAPQGAGNAPQFEAALSHCRSHNYPRALFDIANRLPHIRRRMRTRCLALFQQWGLWHDDDRLKTGSIRPLEFVLRVPELRTRALLGPNIEAQLVASTIGRVTNARQLSRELQVTYAATHAAVSRLVGRGLLVRNRNGVRQELKLSPIANASLTATV
jgi:DNA-binding MarR family transcriptional regulator